MAAPDTGRHPGIVLIHDVWGLADHTRDVSRRLADEGFHVLGIDLYREFASKEIENPGSWIQNLSDPDLLADIRAAARFLAGHPDTEREGGGRRILYGWNVCVVGGLRSRGRDRRRGSVLWPAVLHAWLAAGG
ncbi:MAG: dienelactone hydrolase family protein [Deltaproteobacteria bacterium]|nr:dienelactone hydrolase family protein [Deltaproteobacteria bacterium]